MNLERENSAPCVVEGCRKTRALHHRFRKFTEKALKKTAWERRVPAETLENICAACGEHRRDHISHTFEEGLATYDPSTIMACSCGTLLKGEMPAALDLKPALEAEGWRLMGKTTTQSVWRCPRCVGRRDTGFRKKIDPRQAMFVPLDEPERRDPG